MAMFTLAQKVYTVRMYYRQHENSRGALDSLYSRYGIAANEENLATVTRIIRTFESTGTILNRFYYNLKPLKEANKSGSTFFAPPKAPVKAKPKQESEIQIVEMQDDDLIVEVLSEFDQEVTFKDEEGASTIHEVEVGDEDEDNHITQIDELDEDDDEDDGDGDEEEEEEDEEAYIIAAAADAEAYDEVVVVGTAARPRPPMPPNRHVRQIRYSLCTECGESVSNHLFRKHMAMHRNPEVTSGEREFPCDMCDQVFKSRSSIFTHRRKHFPHLQFVCEVCAKVSTSKATHNNHMLVSGREASLAILKSHPNSFFLPAFSVIPTRNHTPAPTAR